MKENRMNKLLNILKEQRLHKRWQEAITVMAAVVIFCTTYALILPAITMEARCGLEEHTHSAACYDTLEWQCQQEADEETALHTHSDDCYDENGLLVCGMADFVLHTHDEAMCYDSEGNLVCTLPEITGYTRTALLYMPVWNDTADYDVSMAEEPYEEEIYADETDGEAIATEEGGMIDDVVIDDSSIDDSYGYEDSFYESESLMYYFYQPMGEDVEVIEDFPQIAGYELTLDEENSEAIALPHEHDESCYDEDYQLVCGQLAVVLHEHSEECIGNAPTCGQEAHQHSDWCYTSVEDAVFYHCGLEAHEHSEACYTADGEVTCQKPEHQHSEACCNDNDVADAEEPNEYICGMEEHQHSEACYTADGELTCQKPENQHSEACCSDNDVADTEEPTEYICGMEEHQHSEACYTADGELTCQKPENQHSEACCSDNDVTDTEESSEYICGMEEHEHSEACYTADGELTCQKPEHQHSEACCSDNDAADTEESSEYICGMEEHQHSEACYTADGELTCQKPEHQHSEACVAAAETVLTANGEGYSVSVSYGAEAHIPADAVLQVEEILAATEKVETALYSQRTFAAMLTSEDDSAQVEAPTPEVMQDKFFAISIVSQENMVEPKALVEVALQLELDAAPEDASEAEYLLVECEEEAVAPTETQDVQVQDSTVTATFRTAEMGTYGVVQYGNEKPAAGQYGKFNLQYNDTKNAFMIDPAYADYYKANSPLGVAGSFHLVGFDTVTVDSHCNGNILANKLAANGKNFGTNGLKNELSYVQQYISPSAVSAAADNHILVIGSETLLQVRGNNGGDEIHIGNVKIDKPYHIIQDQDTGLQPFIDLEEVKKEIEALSDLLGEQKENSIIADLRDQNNRYLELVSPDGAGYYNITATELNNYSDRPLKMKGFQSGHNGTIVINVDCKDWSGKIINMPEARIYIDDKPQSTDEVTEFSNGKVIWNFMNADNVTIETKVMTGMIVAPGATVNIAQNLNGTVVAENINVKAESHRTDFTGTVIPANVAFDALKYIDNIKEPTETQKFKFHLEELNAGEWNVVKTTENEGKFINFNIQYSTADDKGDHWYRIYEDKTPVSGYELSQVEYVMKVTVTETTEAGSTTYTAEKTYYKVVTDDYVKVDGTIDETKLEKVEHGKYDSVFNNKTTETDEPSYTLPETGGRGVGRYTTAGILLMGAALLLRRQQSTARKGEL